jgi:hypothetical protein
VYVDAIDQNGAAVDLIPLLRFIARSSKSELHSACLVLDDRKGLENIGPHSLGNLDLMEETHGVEFLV